MANQTISLSRYQLYGAGRGRASLNRYHIRRVIACLLVSNTTSFGRGLVFVKNHKYRQNLSLEFRLPLRGFCGVREVRGNIWCVG